MNGTFPSLMALVGGRHAGDELGGSRRTTGASLSLMARGAALYFVLTRPQSSALTISDVFLRQIVAPILFGGQVTSVGIGDAEDVFDGRNLVEPGCLKIIDLLGIVGQ